MRRGAALALLGLLLGCSSSSSDNSALYSAIGGGDAASVRSLVAAGADPDSTAVGSAVGERIIRPASGRPPPPLVFAIIEKQPECALALLESGARADVRDDDGFSALEHATSLGQAAVVAALLERGADPRASSKHGFPLVFVAAAGGNSGIVRAFLDRGADPNARDAAGAAASHYVGSLDSVYEKLAGRSGLRARPGATAMMLAAQRGHADAVRAFLEKGADPNARDEAGRDALMLVAEEGIGTSVDGRYLAVAAVLVERKLDLGAKDAAGGTALDRARRLAGLSPHHAELQRRIEAAAR